MTALDPGPMRSLEPARRALDEQVIRDHGHVAAIVRAPTEATAVRRAGLVLGQHRRGMEKVPPVDVALAICAWWMMQRAAS